MQSIAKKQHDSIVFEEFFEMNSSERSGTFTHFSIMINIPEFSFRGFQNPSYLLTSCTHKLIDVIKK